ncbi:hypothetical protein BRC62_00760 [Halobacteriales archaeon QH_10_67_13]|nr:MAG: hypothetical protein BRC62_00760 [Halobacteriales archaeon QH_10_67_13]
MTEAVLQFPCGDPDTARRVARSLAPEAGAIDDDRSSVQLARQGDTVEITVTAADLTALRAGLNTWFRLVGVAERAGTA